MTKQEELKDRVEAKKHELLSKYNSMKADSRHEAHDLKTKLKMKLDELELYLKGGWEKVSDATRAKLDKWLDEK